MSFEKHSIQTVLVRTCLILFVLVAGKINACWLGPEGIGVLALLLLVRNFAFRFGNLGFGSAFAFYAAKKKVSTRRLLQILWLTGSVASLLSTIVLLAVWRCKFSPWNDIQPSVFYLCLPTVVLIFFNNYFSRLLSGELKITQMNIANLFMVAGNVVFLVILVIVFEMGVAGAILSVVLSDLLTFFYLVLQSRKGIHEAAETEGPGGKGALVYSLWRYGKWNYLLMFTNFLVEELPLMLLKSLLANNAAVGLFTKARDLGRQSRIVSLPISQVLFPYTAASTQEQASSRTNILCRNSIVVMSLAVAFTIVFIKPIILILSAKTFLPAAKIFYVLAPGVLLWPLGHFLAVHVAASGKPRAVFLASLATLVVAVVVCWFMIPRYGAIGSGLSVSVICATQTFLRLLVYVRVTGASFSEVLFLRRTDLIHYQQILTMLLSRFVRKSKKS